MLLYVYNNKGMSFMQRIGGHHTIIHSLVSSLAGCGGGWSLGVGVVRPGGPRMRAGEYESELARGRRKPPAGVSEHPRFGRGRDHGGTLRLLAREIKTAEAGRQKARMSRNSSVQHSAFCIQHCIKAEGAEENGDLPRRSRRRSREPGAGSR
jgi:hypothetical protein